MRNCFERVNSDRIMLEEFLDWMIAEPQTIVWLPTLHRLAVSETGMLSVRHESLQKKVHDCMYINFGLCHKNFV